MHHIMSSMQLCVFVLGQGLREAPAELGALGGERHGRGDAHGLRQRRHVEPLREAPREGAPQVAIESNHQQYRRVRY